MTSKTSSVKNSTDESKELKKYLTEEIARLEQRGRLTWRIGLPVAIIVFIYMSWVAFKFDSLVLNPSNLATVTTQQIAAEAPKLIDNAEIKLTVAAPRFAYSVFEQLLGMIPIIEDAGFKQIDVLAGTVSHLERESAHVVDFYFKQHREAIKAFIDTKDDQKFAEHFVNTLLEGLAHEISKDFNLQYASKDIRGIQNVSLLNLGHMNEYISRLANQHPLRLSRQDRLQRRLIVSWYKTWSPYLIN